MKGCILNSFRRLFLLSATLILLFLLLLLSRDRHPVIDPSVGVRGGFFSTAARGAQGGLDSGKNYTTWNAQCDQRIQEEHKGAVIDSVDVRRSGYVLVLDFHEQQTKASNNLFTLQCWAKNLFVNIVEPFVINSHLSLPISEKHDQYFRYRDVFDMQKWSLLTAHYRFSPLVSWETFLAKAPRKLIVVRFRYLSPWEYKQRKENGVKLVHLATNSSRYKEGCLESPELDQKVHHLTVLHNFTVIRDVCLNFAEGDELTLSQFNRHIFGGTGSKSATVLMEQWRGLSSSDNGKRVVLFDGCWTTSTARSMYYTWPSHQLLCDAKKYKDRYIPTDQYITIMVRTEKMESLSANEASMGSCLNQTLVEWKKLKKLSGIKHTFLSIDIGKYGSYSLIKNQETKYIPYVHLYKKFLKDVFGDQTTLESWEAGFETVVRTNDSGYIGSLQKVIASQSSCIVFTGGGSFQKHTKYMYEHTTSTKRRRKCTRIVRECSRGIA